MLPSYIIVEDRMSSLVQHLILLTDICPHHHYHVVMVTRPSVIIIVIIDAAITVVGFSAEVKEGSVP